MPSEGFFMAMGGLGLSLAGFAGLLAAFHQSSEGEPEIYRWRIALIVSSSLTLVFLAFGVIPVHELTGEVDLTVRLITAGVVISSLFLHLRFSRPGPAWPDEDRRRIVFWFVLATLAVIAVNVIVAEVWFLQLIMLWLLFSPVSAFYNAVRDVAAATTGDEVASGKAGVDAGAEDT